MAAALPTKEEMNCLGHFNMELFYFSEIIDSFSLNSPLIDQSSVKYLNKILLSVANLLGNNEIRKVYDSIANIVPEDFQRVTLERSLVCHKCKEAIPFLWQLFQEHKCSVKGKNKKKVKEIKLDKMLKFSEKYKPIQEDEDPANDFVKFEQELMNALDDDNDLNYSDTDSDDADLKLELQRFKKEEKAYRKMIKEQKKIKKERKKTKKDPEKMVFSLKKKSKTLLRNPKEVMDRIKIANEKEKTLGKNEMIVTELEKLLGKYFPKVKVYPFGSRVTGLGSENSDLDLFVDVDNYYNNPLTDREKITDIMKEVGKILKNTETSWSDLCLIDQARTPILKVHNLVCGIPCDISFGSGLSDVNSKLISYFFDLQPDCYFVACFLTEWCTKSLKRYNARFSSYLISLLVIFYMQTIALLPPIWDLQKKIKNPVMIGDWQGDFEKPTLTQLGIVESDDPVILLKDFFEFYNTFDFEKYVVCPVLGKPLERLLLLSLELLPDEMMLYKTYVQNLPADEKTQKKLLQMDSKMIVQDPLELCHNVAKVIDPYLFAHFKQLCGHSAKSLQISTLK